MRTRYKVIYGYRGPEDEQFIKDIEWALADGWKLQGGISISHDSLADDVCCAQAVTKEEH